jgi:[protein-PII] uridylyltransferase
VNDVKTKQAKVAAHADEVISLDGLEGKTRPQQLAIFKRFLKIENHRIKLAHRAGLDGFQVAGNRSDLLDIVLGKVFDEAFQQFAGEVDAEDGEQFPIALVAVGGYGRGLLNPGSDIDLLFLSKTATTSLSKATNEAVERVLYLLWDIGFEVGHSVRSIRESLSQAKKDFQVFTAMIESRFIAGNRKLFHQLEDAFYRRCVVPLGEDYLQDRLEDRRSQHAKAQTIYLQEPNVKEGQGGLRDYHNSVWLTYVKLRSIDLGTLVKQGLLSDNALQEMEKAYHFLLTVRNHLHYAEKHATDVLTLRLQGVVATAMGYPQPTILRRCESFMRDYYQHTTNLFMRSNEVLDRFKLESRSNAWGMHRLGALTLAWRGREEFDGFYAENNRAYASSPDIFDEDPGRLMRLFRHTQIRGLRMSPELIDLVQASFAMVNKTYRYNRANRETFEAILSSKGSVAWSLRQMHRVGFLGRFMPEFGALTCLVQHEFFHRYTADEHTLKTIEVLDGLVGEDDRSVAIYQDIFHHLEDPFTLYLSLIMHDTGRAANARHHEDASALLAAKVCNRFRVHPSRRSMILFLVDHHLTFYRTATTRNIEDSEVVAEFGRICGSKERLDLLLLFTYVDSRGTSEEGWTGWKESLILQLHRTTRDYLRDSESFARGLSEAKSELREKVEAKMAENYGAEIEAHFFGMPPRYFNFRSSKTVVSHIRLFRKFFESLSREIEDCLDVLQPVFEWQPEPDKGWTELRVASWNQSFLLARVSGALAANGINIIAADLFRRKDDVVLDLFRVCRADYTPVENTSTMAAVEKTFSESIKVKKFSFQPLIKKAVASARAAVHEELHIPTRVVVRNDPNGRHTLIEIQAADRIGLLHDIFSAIAGFRCEVCHARINTERGAAVDTIYIWDASGKPLDDRKQMKDLEETIQTLVT